MLTKREFLSLYDETVLGIRQIKNNNDKINKSIGVLNEASLYGETEAQKQMIENLLRKVDQMIQKMQKSYLDPDTARKIGVVKQQLRIQRDRREQLLQNVNQITKEYKNKYRSQKQQQLTPNSNVPSIKVSKRSSVPISSNNPSIQMQSGDIYKRSQITNISDYDNQTTSQTQHQVAMHLNDYDHQVQRKLIQQRSQQLHHAHERMLNIKNIVSQTSDLVYAQGDKLDIIGDDLFHTYKNVSMANGELAQANQHQRKAKRKYIVMSLLLLLIVGGIVFIAVGL